MIGGIFIPRKRTEAAYSTMASYLRKHCPELRNLKAFGTDGDQALVNDLKAIFPDAHQLLCDLHMRDNIEAQLRKANVSLPVRLEILCDIFGCRTGSDKKGIRKCRWNTCAYINSVLLQVDLLIASSGSLTKPWNS